MAEQQTIPPFWTRLPQFFRFPFHFASLIYLVGLSLATVVVELMGGWQRIKILLFVVFLRYAYGVMESGARGQFNPESANFSDFTSGDKRPYKQTIVFLVYGLLLLGLAHVFSKPNSVPTPAGTVAALKQADSAGAARDASAPDADRLPGEASAGSAAGDSDAGADKDLSSDSGDSGEAASAGDAISPQAEADKADAAREARLRQIADDERNLQRAREEVKKRNNSGLWASILEDENRHLTPMFFLWAIVFALPLPAAVMVIALEDRLLRALNPANFFYFVGGMGRAYFILWGFFVLIFLLREGLLHLLPGSMAAVIRSPLESFFSMYLLLALYSMMGYALYQYHQELGHDVHVDFDGHQARESGALASEDPLERKVREAVKAGNIESAIGFLHDELRYEPNNVPLNERLYDLVLKQGESNKIVRYGKQYLNALMAAGQGGKALPVWRKIVEQDPTFELPGDMILPLASALMAQRDYPAAITLMKGFDRKFPGHADIPGVYLNSARIACDHMRKDEMAIKFLKVLLQRYPDWERIGEAKTLLATLEQVQQKPA
jgi:tetratricopeptide (TPR) repeat protein